jgi:hypothetical protein
VDLQFSDTQLWHRYLPRLSGVMTGSHWPCLQNTPICDNKDGKGKFRQHSESRDSVQREESVIKVNPSDFQRQLPFATICQQQFYAHHLQTELSWIYCSIKLQTPWRWTKWIPSDSPSSIPMLTMKVAKVQYMILLKLSWHRKLWYYGLWHNTVL